MKRVVLVCLLIAAPVLAKRFVRLVADDWRIEGTTLRFTPRAAVGSANAEPAQALAIDEAALARALEIEPEAVAGYLKGLDPKLPILIEPGFYKTRSVVGIRQLTEERLRSDLRLELSPTLEARLVNAGKWTHRVVKPGDGSESGWREPEVYLEREVDGKWVRGAKPGRCGLYAHDWQKDVIDLKLGDALPIGGFVEPRMAFGLSAPAKAKVRLVYVYRGGRASKGREVEPEPGPMAKTPPFAIFSEPVEMRIE